MELSEEQKAKAKKQFEEDIKDVDEDDVIYASKKGQTKINQLEDAIPSALFKLWNDIKLMISLLTDYIKGDYTETPWKVIAAIAGAIIYFISPIDAIPDFIPVVGYLDDALIIRIALDFAEDDLEKYKIWAES